MTGGESTGSNRKGERLLFPDAAGVDSCRFSLWILGGPGHPGKIFMPVWWRRSGFSVGLRLRVAHDPRLSGIDAGRAALDGGRTSSRQRDPEKMEKAVGIAPFSGSSLVQRRIPFMG